MLDVDGVGRLLDTLGYGKYSQAFVDALIGGLELLGLEPNSDLSKVGVDMPLPDFKNLVGDMNEVIFKV